MDFAIIIGGTFGILLAWFVWPALFPKHKPPAEVPSEPPIAADVAEAKDGHGLVIPYLERAYLTGSCNCPVAGCFHRNQPNLWCRPDYCREKKAGSLKIEDSPGYKLGQEMAERREKAIIEAIIGGDK